MKTRSNDRSKLTATQIVVVISLDRADNILVCNRFVNSHTQITLQNHETGRNLGIAKCGNASNKVISRQLLEVYSWFGVNVILCARCNKNCFKWHKVSLLLTISRNFKSKSSRKLIRLILSLSMCLLCFSSCFSTRHFRNKDDWVVLRWLKKSGEKVWWQASKISCSNSYNITSATTPADLFKEPPQITDM